MDSFFTRYRNFLVLFALLIAQIVGLAVQVRHTADGHGVLDPKDGPGVRLIRYWAESIVAQPEGLIHSTKLGLGNLWQGYIDLHNVRQQNLDLQRTVDRLRLEQASLMEDARQGQRLQAMLGFQQKYIYSALPAQVIGSSGSDQSRVFYIDKGSADGLKPDMAVVTADGIVGKIRDVFPHTSQVLAANDQTAGAHTRCSARRFDRTAGNYRHRCRSADSARRKGSYSGRRSGLSARPGRGRGAEGGPGPGPRLAHSCLSEACCSSGRP